MRKYDVELEDYHGHFFHHRFEAKNDNEALNEANKYGFKHFSSDDNLLVIYYVEGDYVDYSNTSTEHFKENIKKYHEIFKYLK